MTGLFGEWPHNCGRDEERFSEMLWDGLHRDGWVIFQNWSICFEIQGRTWNRQSDVIAIHPDGVLFVFEVKGGTVQIEDGQFLSVRRGYTPRVCRNPYDQASDLLFDILNEAADKRIITPEKHFYYDYTAVFPSTEVKWESTLKFPANMSRDRTIDQPYCTNSAMVRYWVLQRVQQLRQVHSRRIDETQGARQMGNLLAKYFLPSVTTTNSLAAIAEEMDSNEGLTVEQRIVIDNALINKRSKVLGNAGTGKTFLVMYAAMRLRRSSHRARILILCYTRKLVKQIKQGLGDVRNEVRVDNIHHFAMSVGGHTAMHDSDISPLIREHGRQLDDAHKYDYVFVDEGQDFYPDWLQAIEELISADGHIVFLADQGQNLFKKGDLLPVLGQYAEFRLKTNCRNTREICRCIEAMREEGDRATSPDHMPDGTSPIIDEYSDNGHQRVCITRAIDGLVRDRGMKSNQIVLLSVYDAATNARSCMYGQAAIGGWQVREWEGIREPEFEGVYMDTTKSFKGCEALGIVLCDIDAHVLGLPSFSEDLYVACSRARVYLHVLHCTGQSLMKWFSQQGE